MSEEMTKEEARRRLLLALPVYEVRELHEILQYREKAHPSDDYFQIVMDINNNLHYIYDEYRQAVRNLIDTSI